MQEAWNNTYVPITDINNPEVRAYVSTLTQEKQNTITPEDALSAANASGHAGRKTFLVLDEGYLDTYKGFWVEDEEDGAEGFLELDEDTFWVR